MFHGVPHPAFRLVQGHWVASMGLRTKPGAMWVDNALEPAVPRRPKGDTPDTRRTHTLHTP